MFPFHLHLFGKYFYYFEGIYYFIAIGLSYFLANSIAKKQGVTNQELQEAIVIAILSGILGARIFQELFYTENITFWSILSSFNIWKSGLSITGGVVLGPLFTYLVCKWKKYNYWKIFTIVIPAVLLAQGLGRVGCFMNGDAHGIETESSFGMTFPKYATSIPEFEDLKDERRVGDAWKYTYDKGLIQKDSLVSAPVHPTQLYEAVLDLFFAFILFLVVRKVFDQNLDLRLAPVLYLSAYSIIRFFIEFVRADRDLNSGALLSNMQMVLLTIFVVGTVFAFRLYKKPIITE